MKFFFVCLALFLSSFAMAKSLQVAVASNFYHSLLILLEQSEEFDANNIKLSSGSTGLLYAQIVRGAPFDVFLSADSLRPQLLEQSGLSLAPRTYAKGQLVLWPANTNVTIVEQLNEFQGRLVIANPKLAPYGKGALEFFQHSGLEQTFAHRLILANNVNQAFQFVYSGNAAKAIISLSQLKLAAQKGLSNKFSFDDYLLLSAQSYSPINQQLVVLKKTNQQELANKFVFYLLSEQVQQQLTLFGYQTGVQ